ncbi:hypothetical protein [Snuella lapsa]|uniref:hypothetical protein n=1 Tax=Snuella lapsa TaxID=870481 RepID=UPI0031E59B65
MKNKTKTYVLIVLVLCIWGIIGYRVLSAINPNAPQIAQQNMEVQFTPNTIKEADNFSVQTVERDPFLGTLYVKKEKKQVIQRPVTKSITWPDVIYHGSISTQHKQIKMFIVSINGLQQFVKPKQTIEGIKLLRGTSQSIVISYKGQRKTVQKI